MGNNNGLEAQHTLVRWRLASEVQAHF
ncbi:hypothetical protein Goklo_001298 [Gossypium klotzschianum]|uniref:Uncharacterized protein n=1 Tax=Gossypium klotzschianum TaxID=34286 RepID=A0A7J8W003_9ROSI|nr:hypothetical protein [Gossypium klotzschianum]